MLIQVKPPPQFKALFPPSWDGNIPERMLPIKHILQSQTKVLVEYRHLTNMREEASWT